MYTDLPLVLDGLAALGRATGLPSTLGNVFSFHWRRPSLGKFEISLGTCMLSMGILKFKAGPISLGFAWALWLMKQYGTVR